MRAFNLAALNNNPTKIMLLQSKFRYAQIEVNAIHSRVYMQ